MACLIASLIYEVMQDVNHTIQTYCVNFTTYYNQLPLNLSFILLSHNNNNRPLTLSISFHLAASLTPLIDTRLIDMCSLESG